MCLLFVCFSGSPGVGEPEPGQEPSDVETTEDTTPPSSSGLATYAKLFIFLVVLFFIYLIYINMESSGNLVPKIKGN
jgi:hypothetical protein